MQAQGFSFEMKSSCGHNQFLIKMTGFEPIIAKNVQKINFKFTMISIFTTLFLIGYGLDATYIPSGSRILFEACHYSLKWSSTNITQDGIGHQIPSQNLVLIVSIDKPEQSKVKALLFLKLGPF